MSGPPSPWRPSRTMVYVAVGVLVLLSNAVGYRLWRRARSRPPVETGATVAPRPPSEAAVPPAPAPAHSAQVSPVPDVAVLARAHRIAGLAALERNDFAVAERELVASQKLDPTRSDLRELLSIVRGLQQAAKRPQHPAPPEPQRPKAVARPVVATRPTELSKAPTELREPANGMLLVASTPSGVLVEVDGKTTDLTPARLSLAPGSHTVVLVRGESRLLERQVRVASNAVVSVDADVTGVLAAKTSPLPEPAPAPAGRIDGAEPGPPPTPARAEMPAPEPKVIAATGELFVISPDVYGEVFINGVGHGFPPVLAKGILAGPALVEIRVDGVARRSMSVQVAPRHRLSVRLR